ncbi:hypothetical protein HDK77DRAFT_430415 [Phyllosticta capitalensis]
MDRQAASARRASASALTSMSACGEEEKSGNGDVQRDDGEKRRRNDEEDDVATVPAAAAVRPASTSSGTLPISAAVDSNYATTTNVESQKFRKSGERGEEDARRLGSSTSLGCAARRHGPITTTQHPDSPPPDYDDCVARAHRDGPLPQTCSSSVADQAMATAAASGVSTTSASTAKSTSTSSSRSKTKDDQPDKEKEYGSHDSNSKPSKDKGKRRADDFSNATGAQHKNDDMLDDTKLSNPNLREATELAALPRPFSSSSSSMSSSATGSRVSQRRVYSGVDATAGGVGSLSQTRSGGSGSSSVRSNLTGPLWWQGVQRWWGRQVSVTVEVKGMRDHLALERTFLGYLRTSIALSMTGVILAQLFRLQHSLHPDEHLGFYVLGIPLASTFIACAIAVALLGAFRFWRQQSAIVRGKVLAGGWEVLVIMGGSLVLTTAVFILLVLVDVRREDKPTYKS